MANLEVINVGAAPNDGEGDPLRTAFQKVNNNFAALWYSNFNTLEAITLGNTPSQLIFTIPVSSFTQATFQINSSDQDSNDSQNIVINASIKNDGSDVRWTGHSTIFIGDPVTNYSMDVSGGNVNLYADPLINAQLTHWIAYQVTHDPVLMGKFIVLNQDATDNLGTEILQKIATEN